MPVQPEIDELFRQRLAEAELPPPAFVWDGVERALRRRRRRRFLFWIFAAALAGSAWWAWPDRDSGDRAVISRSTPPATSTDAAPTVPPRPHPAAAAAPPETPNLPQTNKPATTTTLLRTPGATAVPVPARPTGLRPGLTSRGLDPQNSPVAALQPAPVAAPAASPAGDPEAGLPEAPTAKMDGRTFRRLVDFKNRPVAPLAFQRTVGLQPIQPDRRSKRTQKRCYDFNHSGPVWMAEVYGGPSYASRTLFTGDPEFFDYRDDRLGTERFDWAYNAGLRAALIFRRNWAIRAGLHYNQITEIFEYYDPNSKHIDIDIVQTPQGPDTTTTITYGEGHVKRYNRLGLLDLPVQMGLELRGGNSGVRVHAGASINLLFWKSGGLFAPGKVPATFTPGRQDLDVFRRRTGLSLLGSVQWFYHLAPRNRIFAELGYRKIVRPVSHPGYPLEQRYGLWDLQVGLSRILP